MRVIGTCNVEKLKIEGIKKISVNAGIVSIEFEEEKISIERLVRFLEISGCRVIREERDLKVRIEGMSCAMCVKAVEKTLRSIPGIVEFNLTIGSARILYDPRSVSKEEILEAIRKLGYKPFSEKEKEFELEKEFRKKKLKKMMKHIIFSLIASFLIMFLNFDLADFFLATLTIVYSGRTIFSKAFKSLKSGVLTMEVMYSLGIGSAYFVSVLSTLTKENLNFYEASTFLITFLLLGKYLEERAKGKLEILKIAELQPKKARVLRYGKEVEVAIGEIRIGEILIVKPKEKIPVDGEVVEGESYVDESTITGEAFPKPKKVGDEVFGGTMNLSSTIKVRVKRIEDSLISQMIRIVEEAQFTKPAIQKFADRIVSYFIPSVVSIAIAAFIYWYLISDVFLAFTVMLSVLAVACPCAFGLATPTALLAGISRGIELGILIKRGDVFENLSKATTILLDKTGTITKGLEVTEVVSFIDRDELIEIAASAEKNSQHPIGRAILKRVDSVEDPEEFEEIVGKGVRAKVRGLNVLIGSKTFILENGIEIQKDVENIAEKLEKDKTVVFVSINGKIAGIIGVSEVIRDDAVETIEEMKRILKVGIVTGDSKQASERIARSIGVNFVKSEVLPKDKVDVVKKFQKDGEIVIFVGDGINDAPALAQADVGIAVGNASDLAIDAGDVVLIKNDLKNVFNTIKLGKKVFSKIKQNFFWATIYNAVLIPFSAGLTNFLFGITFRPEWAAAAMSLSSLSVVTNSLLLKRYKVN
ncbi:MAG: heavy metal translocating P-type ATPase [Archaeoglobaceae archaeon]|nr:heavy metal translocating P-type ATPase [Archaeoglobaceae archaeon]